MALDPVRPHGNAPVKPQPPNTDYEELTGPYTILLWEDTCAEWLTALIGAGGQSIAVATSYATLGIDAVAEALNNSQCPVVSSAGGGSKARVLPTRRAADGAARAVRACAAADRVQLLEDRRVRGAQEQVPVAQGGRLHLQPRVGGRF